MMIRPRHAAAPIALLAIGVALSGCSSDKTINSSQVEKQITDSQQAKAVGLAVTEAHCPTGQSAKVGTVFTCTVKINGIQVSYKATVDSVSSSQAHITTEPTKPIINAKGAADGIAQAAGTGWTVDCGPQIQQVDIGFVLTCKATNGTDTQNVSFKVTDATGTLQPITGQSDTSTTAAPADTTTSTP